MSSIAVRLAPWALLAVGLLAGVTYVQHINSERDTLAAELEGAREAAAGWKKQYHRQQKLAARMVDALEARTDALEQATRGIDASRRALNKMEAEHDEIKTWMGGDLPGGIADWLRVLQQPGTAGNDNPMPDDTGTADDAAQPTGGGADQPARPAGAGGGL